jgi:hypothetical protein
MIVSFTGYTAPARYDDQPWTQVRIEEAAASTGTWATIDTQDIDPVDTDASNPEPHNYTTIHGTGPDLWYRLTYLDADANESAPTSPSQNTAVASYASTTDLFRILKVNNPSAAQTVAAQGDLDTATLEINAEIDLSSPPMFTVEQAELLKGVCLDRAADLWRHRESAPGILGIVDESVPTTPGRYSWARYAARLSVLKDQWGIA